MQFTAVSVCVCVASGLFSSFFVSLSVPLCVCLSAKYDGIDSSGEVSLEVSALRHPATGEIDGKIRDLGCFRLKGMFVDNGYLQLVLLYAVMNVY